MATDAMRRYDQLAHSHFCFERRENPFRSPGATQSLEPGWRQELSRPEQERLYKAEIAKSRARDGSPKSDNFDRVF